MNIGRATEYRNTSQVFIGVNLLKIVEGTRTEAGVGSGEGVSPSPVGVGSGAPEIFFFDFVLRNVELFSFMHFGLWNREIVFTAQAVGGP